MGSTLLTPSKNKATKGEGRAYRSRPGLHAVDKENYTKMANIAQLKERLSIGQIVSPYTGGLVRSGRSNKFLMGWCPVCQGGKKPRIDSRRKLWVNTESGTCNCFRPGCGQARPMDMVNFLCWVENLTTSEAVRRLENWR